MTVGTYLIGALALVAILGAPAYGSHRLVGVLLPGWRGAPAALARVVVALAVGLGVAQIVGAVGLLTTPALVVGELAAGAAMVLTASRPGVRPQASGDGGSTTAPARPARSPWEVGAAIASAGLLTVQWLSHTLDAAGRGMVHPDTLWYHMPFSARFVQNGGFPTLDGVGYEAARWFPFDSHLLHAALVLPHGRDWLSPYANLGWFALGLLAAWCVGEHRRAGPTAVVWTSVAIGLPIVTATNPGQASTDMACSALLLAAAALVLESRWRPLPLAIAGAAAGLAVSTKVSLAVPIAVLVLLVLAVTAVHRRDLGATLAWLGGVAATGTFWYGRNWVLTGSPLPWFDLPAPFGPATAEERTSPSLFTARELSRETWDALYQPGLEQAFGRMWPLVLVLVLVGPLLVLRGRGAAERIVGAVAAAAVIGYLVTPLTAGVSFGFNLRYVAPALLLSGAVVPLVAPEGPRSRLVASGLGLVLVGWGATTENVERIEAWPDATGLAVVVVVVAAGVGVLVRSSAVRERAGATPWLGGAVIVAVVLTGGWALQAYQADHRYLDAGLLPSDVPAETLRTISDARVGLYGNVETYPMFGADLSNDVELGRIPDEQDCAGWRQLIGESYDVVVVARLAVPDPAPPEEILATDPGAVLLARDGDSFVYRIDAGLDPTTCPPGR